MALADMADAFISNALAAVSAPDRTLPAKWRRKSGKSNLFSSTVKTEPVDDALARHIISVKTEAVEHDWLANQSLNVVGHNTADTAIDVDGEQDMDISRENTPVPVSREVVTHRPIPSAPKPLSRIKTESTEPILGSFSSSSSNVIVKQEIIEDPDSLRRDDTLTCAFIDLTLDDEVDVITWEKRICHASSSSTTQKVPAPLVKRRALSSDIDLADHTAYLKLLDKDCRSRSPTPVKEVVTAWWHREDSLDRILFAEDVVEVPPPEKAKADVEMLAAPARPPFVTGEELTVKREPSLPIDLSRLPSEPIALEVRHFGLLTPSPPPSASPTRVPEPVVQERVRPAVEPLQTMTPELWSPVVKREPMSTSSLLTPPLSTTKARARKAAAARKPIVSLPSPPSSQGSPPLRRRTPPSPLYPLKVAGLKRKTPDDESVLPTPVSAPGVIRLAPFKNNKAKKGKVVKSAHFIVESDDEQEKKEEAPRPTVMEVAAPPTPEIQEEKKVVPVPRNPVPAQQQRKGTKGKVNRRKTELKVSSPPPQSIVPVAAGTDTCVKRPRKRTKKVEEKKGSTLSTAPYTNAAVVHVPPPVSYPMSIKREELAIELLYPPESSVDVNIKLEQPEPEQQAEMQDASEILALELGASWGLRRSQRIPKPRIKKEIEEFTDLLKLPTRKRRRNNAMPAGTKDEPIVVEKVFIRISAEKVRAMHSA